MRIFDLLNDGAGAADAAPAAPHKAIWMAPTCSDDRDDDQPNMNMREATAAPPPFPTIFASTHKPWKPQQQPQMPMPSLASVAGKALGKDGKPQHAAKTMSIFDIVTSKSRLLLHPQPTDPAQARKPTGSVVREPQDEVMETARPVAPLPVARVPVATALPKPMPAPVDIPAKKREYVSPVPAPVKVKRARRAAPTPAPVREEVAPPTKHDEDEELEEQEQEEQPRDGQALKRQRQRVLFRRNYYKRMNTIAEMREVRSELEEEYQQLMWKRNAEQMVKTYLRKGRAKQPMEELRESYMDLCRAKDMLRQENSAIEVVLQDLHKVHDKMRWLVDAEGGLRADDHIDLTLCPKECQGADPLTKDECVDLAQQSSNLVLRHFLQPISRGQVLQTAFGWQVLKQHFMSNQLLLANKTFAATTAKDTAQQTWHMLSTASDALRMVVGRSLLTRCYQVQRVNADHVQLYLQFAHDDGAPVSALCLCSRVVVAPGETLLTVRALPAPLGASSRRTALNPLAPNEPRWLEDLMAWVRFTEQGDKRGTNVCVGASLPATASNQEEHWLRLLVVGCVQLEGQLFDSHAATLFE